LSTEDVFAGIYHLPFHDLRIQHWERSHFPGATTAGLVEENPRGNVMYAVDHQRSVECNQALARHPSLELFLPRFFHDTIWL
jgi:hypothetical protein